MEVQGGDAMKLQKECRGQVMGLPWGSQQGWKGACSGGVQWSCDENFVGLKWGMQLGCSGSASGI